MFDEMIYIRFRKTVKHRDWPLSTRGDRYTIDDEFRLCCRIFYRILTVRVRISRHKKTLILTTKLNMTRLIIINFIQPKGYYRKVIVT